MQRYTYRIVNSNRKKCFCKENIFIHKHLVFVCLLAVESLKIFFILRYVQKLCYLKYNLQLWIPHSGNYFANVRQLVKGNFQYVRKRGLLTHSSRINAECSFKSCLKSIIAAGFLITCWYICDEFTRNALHMC